MTDATTHTVPVWMFREGAAETLRSALGNYFHALLVNRDVEGNRWLNCANGLSSTLRHQADLFAEHGNGYGGEEGGRLTALVYRYIADLIEREASEAQKVKP